MYVPALYLIIIRQFLTTAESIIHAGEFKKLGEFLELRIVSRRTKSQRTQNLFVFQRLQFLNSMNCYAQ